MTDIPEYKIEGIIDRKLLEVARSVRNGMGGDRQVPMAIADEVVTAIKSAAS